MFFIFLSLSLSLITKGTVPTQAFSSWPFMRTIPRPETLEQWFKDRNSAIVLHQPDHTRISAWVKDEGCHRIPVSMQSCHHRVQEMGVGRENVEQVLEGGGQVGLEGCALTRQNVGHITWQEPTARQATGTRLLGPLSSQPARPVPATQHLSNHGRGPHGRGGGRAGPPQGMGTLA